MRHREIQDLVRAARELRARVEGINAERWACKGERLCDSPEWIAFYVALNRFDERQRSSQNQSRSKPNSKQVELLKAVQGGGEDAA